MTTIPFCVKSTGNFACMARPGMGRRDGISGRRPFGAKFILKHDLITRRYAFARTGCSRTAGALPSRPVERPGNSLHPAIPGRIMPGCSLLRIRLCTGTKLSGVCAVSVRRLNGSEFHDLAGQILDSGHRLRFQASGRSMLPFIQDGDILEVAPLSGKHVRSGEVLLVETDDGEWLAHRVVNRRNRVADLHFNQG